MPQFVSSAIQSKNWQRIRQISYISVVTVVSLTVVLVVAGFVFTGQASSIVAQVINFNEPVPEAPQSENRRLRLANLHCFAFTDLDNHPDVLHGEYTAATFLSLDDHPVDDQHLSDFRDLLNIYVSRQADDDNFTVRVIDRRTSGLLERYTMEDLRQQYIETGEVDWGEVDALRGTMSGRLIGKYRRRGVPLEDIMIKWGRLDQVKEARVRDEPYISYEIRLSQMLDLSLLSTELGTVETFNDDKLVSTGGRPESLPDYAVHASQVQYLYLQPLDPQR